MKLYLSPKNVKCKKLCTNNVLKFVCAYMCVCVCVCERERERERETCMLINVYAITGRM